MQIFFALILLLCTACSFAPVSRGLSNALAVTGQTAHHDAQRSTRWKIAHPSSVILSGEFDESSAADHAFLVAARDGLRRVIPQTQLNESPIDGTAMREAVTAHQAELRIHVRVPSYQSAVPMPGAAPTVSVDVALLDGRSGQLIERAQLRMSPAWWQMRVDEAHIAGLFEHYAEQLVASQ